MAGIQDVTADELGRYLKIQERRRELGREVRALEKEETSLHDKFHAAMSHDQKTSCTRYGFPMILEQGQVYVPWKKAFIDKLGPDAAAEVEANTPPKPKVKIYPSTNAA